MQERPIGFLDSGLGGLSVLKAVKKVLPRESIEYFADNQRQPYGEKTQKELIEYTTQIIEFLIKQEIKLCIIACNTATAASLTQVKKIFDIPIIGVIEPAVQDAIKATSSNRIGVIATEFTIKNQAYPNAIKNLAPYLEIFTNYCPEFVSIVESGKFTDSETYIIAQEYLKPLKEAHIDTLILGCTHYSFLKKVISDIMGSDVKLIDSAESVSFKLKEILIQNEILNRIGNPTENYYTTGSIEKVTRIAKIILNDNSFNMSKIILEN